MFSILRRLTQLDESNAFADDQGRAEWPDINAYAKNPQFSVTVILSFDHKLISVFNFFLVFLTVLY